MKAGYPLDAGRARFPDSCKLAHSKPVKVKKLTYRLWLETGDRQFLDDSIIYNEDDCRAKLLIKGWLADATLPVKPPRT